MPLKTLRSASALCSYASISLLLSCGTIDQLGISKNKKNKDNTKVDQPPTQPVTSPALPAGSVSGDQVANNGGGVNPGTSNDQAKKNGSADDNDKDSNKRRNDNDNDRNDDHKDSKKSGRDKDYDGLNSGFLGVIVDLLKGNGKIDLLDILEKLCGLSRNKIKNSHQDRFYRFNNAVSDHDDESVDNLVREFRSLTL